MVEPVEGKMYSPIPVRGYRELSQAEIDAMNACKRYEEWVHKFWSEIYVGVTNGNDSTHPTKAMQNARQHFQEAFMWMNRAIAKPTNDW